MLRKSLVVIIIIIVITISLLLFYFKTKTMAKYYYCRTILKCASAPVQRICVSLDKKNSLFIYLFIIITVDFTGT